MAVDSSSLPARPVPVVPQSIQTLDSKSPNVSPAVSQPASASCPKRKRKLFRIFLIIFLILGFFSLYKKNLSVLKNGFGSKLLVIYLRVNIEAKTVSLKKIEGRYGFIPEINTNLDQVVKVVKDGKVINKQGFNLEIKGEIFAEEESSFERETFTWVEREDFVAVPYIKGSQITIEDTDGNKTYLTISSDLVESFKIQESLKNDFVKRLKEELAPQITFPLIFQKKPSVPETTVDRFKLIQQLIETAKQLPGKENSPVDSRIKGVSSKGKNIKILYVGGVWSGFNNLEDFIKVVDTKHSSIMKYSPFKEFSSQIEKIITYSNSFNPCEGVPYYPYETCFVDEKCKLGNVDKKALCAMAPGPALKIKQLTLLFPGVNIIVAPYSWQGRGVAFFGVITLSSFEDRTFDLVHELGHNPIGLADEYVSLGDSDKKPAEVNCSTISPDGTCEKWGNCCYQGCKYANWGKFSPECLMGNLTNHFCSVCSEKIRSYFTGQPYSPPLSKDCSTPAPSCLVLIQRVNTLIEEGQKTGGSLVTCGDVKYDRVADVNKDKYINLSDSKLVHEHYFDEVWCAEKLNDQTDPCFCKLPDSCKTECDLTEKEVPCGDCPLGMICCRKPSPTPTPKVESCQSPDFCIDPGSCVFNFNGSQKVSYGCKKEEVCCTVPFEIKCSPPDFCLSENICTNVLKSRFFFGGGCKAGTVCCALPLPFDMRYKPGDEIACPQVFKPPITNCLKRPFLCIRCLLLAMKGLTQVFLIPFYQIWGIKIPEGSLDWMNMDLQKILPQ